MASRFTKDLCVTVLRSRASRIQKTQEFNTGHGTAQLVPNYYRATQEVKNLVDRAVEYGRMRSMMDIAEEIESNTMRAPDPEN